MSDCQKPDGWREGMRDAAQLLAIYPDEVPYNSRWILNMMREKILAAAGIEETKPTNRQRLGNGVTAEIAGSGDLRLSVQHGDGSEGVILMDKDTCENLMRYIRAHVFCREEG